MNCTNCKNPIQDNTCQCEWCGNQMNVGNIKNDADNAHSSDISNKSTIKSKNNIFYIIPGLAILFIWILGNVISERDKRAIFNMDDLSPILIFGLVVLFIGLIIYKLKK